MATWACRSHQAQHSFVIILSHFLVVIRVIVVMSAMIAGVIRSLDMLRYAWADPGFITLVVVDLILTEDIWRTSRGLLLSMWAFHVFLAYSVFLACSLLVTQLILINVNILIKIYLNTVSQIAEDCNLLVLYHSSLRYHHLLFAIKVRPTWFNSITKVLLREINLVWRTTCTH